MARIFEKIAVQKATLILATNEEMTAFEERTGIVLPEGYKEYCQVFGAGEIGNGVIEIHNPYHYMATYGELWLTRLTKDEIEPLETQDVEDMEDYELNNYWTVKKLLSSGLVFGVNSKAQCFFWDLNSYSNEDKSYDIYAMSHENYESCKLERDFYRFIYNYCLGMKIYKNIPSTFILDDEEFGWIFR